MPKAERPMEPYGPSGGRAEASPKKDRWNPLDRLAAEQEYPRKRIDGIPWTVWLPNRNIPEGDASQAKGMSPQGESLETRAKRKNNPNGVACSKGEFGCASAQATGSVPGGHMDTGWLFGLRMAAAVIGQDRFDRFRGKGRVREGHDGPAKSPAREAGADQPTVAVRGQQLDQGIQFRNTVFKSRRELSCEAKSKSRSRRGHPRQAPP
jgi:hypothetical protein